MLGMYVHTHWGYNRPYSARSWTLADWRNYLNGLSRLGFDAVKVWPQLDCMPPEPTASDRAYLNTLAQAIDLAHDQHGMKVVLVVAPNCIGNDKAVGYEFATRPYFVCEKKVNPKDEGDVSDFLAARRNQLSFLSRADALAIIDSDPGGYIGSTTEDFVNLCVGQTKAFRSLNPQGEFVYWMLAGWECYCRFWAAQRDEENPHPNLWDYHSDVEFGVTLALMKEYILEPWWLFAWLPAHEQAIDAHGLRDKALLYPYGVIEGEPTFPLTVCYGGVDNALTPEQLQRHPLGVMGNAQTHCLQLPHTYLFAHIAQGGTAKSASLAGFAERLLPGLGERIADGWNALESRDPERQMQAACVLRKAAGKSHVLGDLSGLLFGDADRFLLDLAMNLELRAALVFFGDAVQRGSGVHQTLGAVLERLSVYQHRVGFVDAYGGVLYSELNQPLSGLDDPGLNAVLHDFEDWRNPGIRNGIVLRLLAAVEQYVRGG